MSQNMTHTNSALGICKFAFPRHKEYTVYDASFSHEGQEQVKPNYGGKGENI